MPRKERIAEVAVRVMREAGEDRVSFGDGVLGDIAHEAGFGSAGIYDAMQRVLGGLERAPDLFEKKTTFGYDSRGLNRRVRLFVIRDGSATSGRSA